MEKTPEYLGWTARDAKRKQYQQQQQRTPHRIGHDDERFSNRSLQKRLIFCDYHRCLKRCRGVGAGYFVTEKLPAFEERQALWENGSLNMTFYCQHHYQQTMGRAEPEWTTRRREERASHCDQCSSGVRDGRRGTDRR